MTSQFIQITTALVSALSVAGFVQAPSSQTGATVIMICRIDPQPDRHMSYKPRRLRVRKLAFGNYEV
jgi:hypothetical protein